MNSRAGFSLIEVLCAILVLGVALVGLTEGITAALSSSKESELQTVAAFIAAGRIELLRADGFLVNGTTEGECAEPLDLYRWKETISSSTLEGLHEVEVAVEHAKTGKAIYTLTTLLFDPPISSTLETTPQQKPGRGTGEGRRF
jgi:prepilin-type N-terminal cleavage/methylation domain-containing protein